MLDGPQKELVGPKIDALVKFDESGPVPLAIKVDGRRLDIGKVTYRWVSHRGAYAIYHFSAELESGERLELAFDSGRMKWKLKSLLER